MKNVLKRGFTLVELLVVVLIIGILSSVALPQYQKTVRKAREAEAKTMMDAIYKSYKLCILSYGAGARECMLQGSSGLAENSDIELSGGHFIESNCTQEGVGCYATSNWYYFMLNAGGNILIGADSVERSPEYPDEPRYNLVMEADD